MEEGAAFGERRKESEEKEGKNTTTTTTTLTTTAKTFPSKVMSLCDGSA